MHKFIVDKTYPVTVHNNCVTGRRYIVVWRDDVSVRVRRTEDAAPRSKEYVICICGSGKNPSEYIYPEGVQLFGPKVWAKDILIK